jgi:D-3-phosphoglycerate dehydrogenase
LSTRTSRFEVVIANSEFPDGNLEQEILGKIGATVKKFQAHNAKELQRITRSAHGILCTYDAPFTKEVISNFENASVIVVSAVGYDNIDVKAATEKGVVVCNVPDYMTFEVAEHTIALILALIRRIPLADRFVRAGEWPAYGPLSWARLRPLSHLDGKVAGIVGFGRIGRQVAERLQAFRMRLIAYDPYVSKSDAAERGVELVSLHTLMKESDVIAVNALLSEETRHLIGDRELRLMKQTAVIVNTSRGKIIDQTALVQTLVDQRIAGAGLDVLEREPPDANDPLLKLENVILTPHVASTSEKSYSELRRMAAEEVGRVLLGERPRHPVNPEALVKAGQLKDSGGLRTNL